MLIFSKQGFYSTYCGKQNNTDFHRRMQVHTFDNFGIGMREKSMTIFTTHIQKIKNKRLMDYVRHGEIQGHYFVFFKAHGPVFYHSPWKEWQIGKIKAYEGWQTMSATSVAHSTAEIWFFLLFKPTMVQSSSFLSLGNWVVKAFHCSLTQSGIVVVLPSL
jgi:hypothetical protein